MTLLFLVSLRICETPCVGGTRTGVIRPEPHSPNPAVAALNRWPNRCGELRTEQRVVVLVFWLQHYVPARKVLVFRRGEPLESGRKTTVRKHLVAINGANLPASGWCRASGSGQEQWSK